MKISITKEFDGQYYIASCDNLPGCYVQCRNEDELLPAVKRAIQIIKRNCQKRNQELPSGKDEPLFDVRVKFEQIATNSLITFFKRHNYHVEYADNQSVLLLNSGFPFNRIHLPMSNNLSPLIVKRIFGPQNTIYLNRQKLDLKASVS